MLSRKMFLKNDVEGLHNKLIRAPRSKLSKHNIMRSVLRDGRLNKEE